VTQMAKTGQKAADMGVEKADAALDEYCR